VYPVSIASLDEVNASSPGGARLLVESPKRILGPVSNLKLTSFSHGAG